MTQPPNQPLTPDQLAAQLQAIATQIASSGSSKQNPYANSPSGTNQDLPVGIPQGYVPPPWYNGSGPTPPPLPAGTTGIYSYGPNGEPQLVGQSSGGVAGPPSPLMGPPSSPVTPGGPGAGPGSYSAVPQPAAPAPYTFNDAYAPAKDPTSVQALQQQLVAAGLLDKTEVHPGIWSDYEANVYLGVLGLANRAGTTADEILHYTINHAAPPPTKYASTTDLSSLADQVIAPTIGRSLTAREMADFTAAYWKWQTGEAQNQQEAAQTLGAPDVAATNSSSFVTQYAKEHFAGDQSNLHLMKGLQAIDAMFKGGG